MDNRTYKLINICEKDINEIAQLHRKIFFNSFSSKLGSRYVKKMFEWFIISEDRFIIGIQVNSAIVGYVGGALGSGSTSGMLQHAYWQGVRSILLRPYLLLNSTLLSNWHIVIRNIARRIFSFRKDDLDKTKIKYQDNGFSSGLVVIGVDESYRNMKLGSVLIKTFCDRSRELNASFGHLSVKSTNNVAINAYLRNGWEIISKDSNNVYLRVLLNE